LNCTVPVGVPEPDDTVALKVTDSPNTDGLEPADCVTRVEVGTTTFTVWSVVPALITKLVSPGYVAVSVFAPAVVDVSEHWPVATAARQLSVPSDTVTFPVGVPAPGALTVTDHCTV
jgi:hypothetical protein